MFVITDRSRAGSAGTRRTPPIASRPLATLETARGRAAPPRGDRARPLSTSCPGAVHLDEQALTERLIAYDTSAPEGLRQAAEFVRGWLESNDLPVEELRVRDLPILASVTGADSGPAVVFHAHLDVVPARPEQFTPRVDADRLYGRGAYDMKGALAGMMCAVRELRDQRDVRLVFVVVPDEESEEESERATDLLIQKGYTGDFAITGEPTDLHIGVQAKGVLAMRLEISGTSSHGATPWLGDNAVLKALDVFRVIEALPFARESSDLFDRPSINLGRIIGGDSHNKVPDSCVIDVEVRYLPGQDPAEIMAQVGELSDVRIVKHFSRRPVIVDRNNPHVGVLTESVSAFREQQVLSIGRDGASEAISFLNAGVPAVEFGPCGGGHHGPAEWLQLSSLEPYRRALVDFVKLVPQRLGTDRHLRIA
jgi:succinyl-diaminopimelate desuccinylase